MTTKLPTPVPPVTLADTEVRFYQDYGYLSLPGFVRAEAVEPLRQEVLDVAAAKGMTPQKMRQASDVGDKLRQFHAYLAGSQLDAMINGEATLSIAAQLAGGPVRRYNPFTAIKAGGGGGSFDFHQDNNYTRHEPAMGSLNIWVALVGMTPENGCLQVVPRSHLAGDIESVNAGQGDSHRKVAVDPEQFFHVRMRAGDAIAFTRWTVHGSGPNHTDEPRLAYALQYHREDVKYLDTKDDQWKLLTENPKWNFGPLESLE